MGVVLPGQPKIGFMQYAGYVDVDVLPFQLVSNLERIFSFVFILTCLSHWLLSFFNFFPCWSVSLYFTFAFTSSLQCSCSVCNKRVIGVYIFVFFRLSLLFWLSINNKFFFNVNNIQLGSITPCKLQQHK